MFKQCFSTTAFLKNNLSSINKKKKKKKPGLPLDNDTLNGFSARVEHLLESMNNSCQKIYSNLTLKEKKAFHDLKNNQSIVIKPCKKGRGICIMNTRDYLSHKDTNLQDHNTYKSLTHNLKKAKSMMFALSYTICIHNTYRPGHNEIPITFKEY